MNNQPDTEVEHKVVTKGPGNQLQTARIEQGVSIEDIARQMNLNAKILKALEEDDYSDIQSPIFIRGYIRTYSRLVGINEDETIKAFAEFYHMDDPEIKSIGNTVPQISSNDILVKWMTYIVIIGLVALLSVWWVNNYKTNELEQPIGTSDQMSPEHSDDLTMEIETIETLPSELNEEDNQSNTDLQITPAVVEENSERDAMTDESNVEIKPEPLSLNVQTVIEEVIEETIEPTLVIEEPLEAVAVIETLDIQKLAEAELIKTYTKETKAPVGSDVLEINVIATSWGEITDASKFKLIQDLMNSGSSYRLVGQKPFKVFLGNAYGVELALNGKNIDFTKHIKSSNNTARFEIEL